MKAINKLILTLALAVPISLVTADELVINSTISFDTGIQDYAPDLSKALQISLIGHEHIVVVPHGFDKPVEKTADTVKTGIEFQHVNLPVTREVAVRTDINTP